MKKLVAAIIVLVSGSASVLAGETYRFSPVNQWDISKTASYWNPIIQYVSNRSGVKLELKIGRTSADTTSFVLADEVEFIFSNHMFSPERDGLGWRVFGRRNTPRLHSQIAVPEDSPVRRLEDLEGKTVVFAGPEAFIGYKVSAAELRSRNINFKTEFGGNQNAAFAQMFAGKAQATGSNSMLIEGYSNSEGRKFRILWTSEGYHDLALMVSKKVPEKEMKAVSQAFLGMHSDPLGREVLHEAARVVGLGKDAYFVPASEADYASYRRFYKTAPAALR